jgi:hypothetical protein
MERFLESLSPLGLGLLALACAPILGTVLDLGIKGVIALYAVLGLL